MTNFAARLKALRRQHGYTQSELGSLLGISTSAVGMYEQGRREPDNTVLRKICEVFSVSADYMLGHNDGPREIETVLKDMCRFSETGGLMFKGKPLGEEETEKLRDAILLAAEIMFKSQND